MAFMFSTICSLSTNLLFMLYKGVFLSLMLSAKLSLAKMSSIDRLLQPAQEQQDDWFLYFGRILSLSSFQQVEKPPRECLCVEILPANRHSQDTADTNTYTELVL